MVVEISKRKKAANEQTCRKSRRRHRRLQGYWSRHRQSSRGGGRLRCRQLRLQQGRSGYRGRHHHPAGGKAVAVAGDVSNPAEAEGIIYAAISNFGKLDILVNNSGVFEFAPIEAITPEHFHKQFNINVLGTLLVTQAAVKHLGVGASIINIGSVVSRITPPASAVYSATKGAIDAITGVLANELGAKKIRVNSINPGMVETEGAHAAGFIGSDFEKQGVATTPLGRTGQPNDIARVAVFLASDDSGWLTGEHLLASGGKR